MVKISRLLTTVVESSSVTWYMIVVDGASDCVVRYRTRIHNNLVEICRLTILAVHFLNLVLPCFSPIAVP